MLGFHPAIDEALKLVRREAITVVASAGNDSTDLGALIPFPASRTYCQTVAALDSVNIKADFSNYGVKINVCAPGTRIYGPFLDSSYAWWDGTSFAAPFVSGMAALIRSARPDLTRDQMDSAICFSATNVDSLNPGLEGLLGTGLVNPVAAIDMVLSGVHGDANGDGAIDITDLISLVDYMFQGGAPVGMWTDCNCDSQIDITDLVAMVEYIFGGNASGCLQL
jgi:subtilisin family serine protease